MSDKAGGEGFVVTSEENQVSDRPMVDEFLSKFPTTTREFFEKMESGFRAEVAKIRDHCAGREQRAEAKIQVAEERVQTTYARTTKLETFVSEQRTEVNRLNGLLLKIQSERNEASEVPSLRSEIADLRRELVRRRDATKTLTIRDQTILDLRAENKSIRQQLHQALQYDVRAENEELRKKNKELERFAEKTVFTCAEERRELITKHLHEQVERNAEVKKLADVIEALKEDLERIPGYVKPEPKVVTGTLPDPS